MKTDLLIFIFEFIAIRDELAGWVRGLILHRNIQKRVGRIMSYISIIGSKVIGIFKFDESIKVNEENCCKFLDKTFF